LVRSRNTDRVHLLVHETDRDPRHTYHWHRIRSDSLRALQDRIVRLRGSAAPEVARCVNWVVSASEKPVTTPQCGAGARLICINEGARAPS
jgi:hypothetical protein